MSKYFKMMVGYFGLLLQIIKLFKKLKLLFHWYVYLNIK